MSDKREFAVVLEAVKKARVSAALAYEEVDYGLQATKAMREVLELLTQAEGLAAQAHYWQREETK